MRARRSRTVLETRSAQSGRIRVVDYRAERRLIVAGAILSAIPMNGDWTAVRREYWWRALAAVAVPSRPRVLLVGLGGGTQVHLLHAATRPRLITVIERDPTIIRIALDYFGLAGVPGLELIGEEAETAVVALARGGRRFEFVMEDAAYGDDPARSQPLALALADRVAPRGVLVVNRHRRGDARELAAALRGRFAEVRLRRVRREGENVLVCCARPLRPRTNRDSA